MKRHLSKTLQIFGIVALLLGLGACTDDLNREPFPVSGLTSATVYKDPANYKAILAKLYAGLATTGQQGPDGKGDIGGIDEGFSQYLRQYWQAQELTTDEAVIAWNDADIWDLHDMDWSSGHSFLRALYYRLFYQISLANEFIRETTDGKLSERGISGSNATNIKGYRAEARFLRALSYYHALDLYGNVPFVTENDPIGSYIPVQTTRAALFQYIESELLAIESELPAPRANEYGRADKGAVWTLLAKLYLNAQVYIGQPKYTECIAQCAKVIAAGYALEPNYRNLFLADNHKSAEIIFPITFDGQRTKTWGGMTYLVHAPIGGTMNPAEFGVNGGWWGLRTTSAFVANFNDVSGNTDKRAMFHTDGQKLGINDISAFNDGYAIAKYRNVTSAGVKGSDVEGNFPDNDFPLLRLADVYLMYAEAVKRGGTGGSEANAIQYINALRTRAYGNNTANVTSYDVDFVLAERARELYWEAHRRTDLIRYGKFTGASYLWPWKGGTKDGKAVEDWRSLFPIPNSDVVANPNLKQNTGY